MVAANTDGRIARAARTREAVIDAVFALVGAGHLQPSIEDVAGRAGVSVRTVFQHFGDREHLFAAVGERQTARVVPLLAPVDAALPFEERVAAFVAQRAEVYELVTPLRRAALQMAPSSPSVAETLERFRAYKR